MYKIIINCSCYVLKGKKKEMAFDTLFWGSSQDRQLKLVKKPVKMKVVIQHLVCALQASVHCYHGAQGLVGIGWVS